MSVLLNKQSKVVIQGFGRAGQLQAKISSKYGTKIVAGVTPGKGGTDFESFPIYNSVQEAVDMQGANVSLIFVPALAAADAIFEATEAGVQVVICITEFVPTLDMVNVKSYLKSYNTRLIGPNCPGVIVPAAKARAGIMPIDVYRPGNIGVVSRSGTLVYEAVDQLSRLGMGQSASIGVGGDPVIGTSQRDALELFENDSSTDAVVLIGEIGGVAEQEAAEYIQQMSKPVVAFIAGATAPVGRRMGHAGAIIAGSAGKAAAKQVALSRAGAHVVESPSAIGQTMKKLLASI